MHTKIIAPLFATLVASPVVAQTLPTTLTQTGTYDATVFGAGGGYGAGGIEFDPSGQYLYVNDINANTIVKLTVDRTGGKITGFSSPTVIVTSATSGWIDAGLTLSSVGTLIATGWSPYEIEQFATTTNTQTLLTAAASGITGTTGGCEFMASTPLNPSRYMMSDYTNGGLYVVPTSKLANDTYTFGTATLLMTTPAGVEGFTEVPSGLWGNGRGLVLVNYTQGTLDLVALEQASGDPFLDASGDPLLVPVITGLFAPMDVEFDPLTGDMFISDYGDGTTTTALLQFEGTVSSLDGDFELFGPGCVQSNGQVPTLSTLGSQTRAGLPISFLMTNGPVNQGFSFLVFGVGATGNSGGWVFPGTPCRVFADPLITVPFATNQAGTATLGVTIPTSALGLTFYSQAYALSPGANAMDLTLSDAAVFLVGT